MGTVIELLIEEGGAVAAVLLVFGLLEAFRRACEHVDRWDVPNWLHTVLGWEDWVVGLITGNKTKNENGDKRNGGR